MTAKDIERIIKAVPKEGNSRPRSWLTEEDEKTIAALFSHRHGPLQAVCQDIYVEEAHIGVRGTFKNHETGRCGGEFYRIIKVRRGEIVIYHDNLWLGCKVRYLGIGRKWHRECERRYRAFGVAEVTLDAGGEAGGYVWAREGFEIKGSTGRVLGFWQEVEDNICLLRKYKCISERSLNRWQRDLASGRISTVSQLARLGCRNYWVDKKGRRCWAGKMLLLHLTWEGYKKL